MSAGDTAREAVEDINGVGLDGASNVLVLAPSMDGDARRSYYETFLPDSPSALDVLAVDYRQTPDQWVDEWRRYVGDRPRRCAIISVNETTRSATTASGQRNVQYGPDTVAGVESPTDLTGLGIAISEFFDEHGGQDTVFTLDSLTFLLQYVDLQRAFRFLHVLSNRVKSTGATAHYHMDPGAHDEQVISTLSAVFDAIAEYDDGEWTIHRR